MKKFILTLLAFASLQTIAFTQTFEGVPIELPPNELKQLESQLTDFSIIHFPE